jgi:type II secretory pathway component PulL
VAACYRQIFLLRSFPGKLDTPSGIEAFCKRVQQTVLSFQGGLLFEFSPESVFVTGDQSSGFEIEEKISKILDLPVKQLDLTRAKNIQAMDTGFQPEKMNSAFALAINEAEGLKCFNFRQGEFAARKQWMEHKASFIKTGIIASVILLLALFNVFFDSYSIGKRIEDIEMQKKDVFLSVFPKAKGVKGPLQLPHMKTKLAEEKKSSPLSGSGKNIRVIDELYDISNFMPKGIDVKFIRLDIKPEDITITGNTDTNSSVDAIKSGLEQSKNFKKITISSASKDKKENRVRFKLKVEL